MLACAFFASPALVATLQGAEVTFALGPHISEPQFIQGLVPLPLAESGITSLWSVLLELVGQEMKHNPQRPQLRA